TPAQQAALAAIDESLTRLTRIAENATMMSQIDSRGLVLVRAPRDVEDLVGDAVAAALAEAHGRRVKVTTELGADLGEADVDGRQMTHAIAQLVSNGIRFTPDGGRVTVSAAYDDETGEFVIAVEDTGVGIPADRQEHVFERAGAV